MEDKIIERKQKSMNTKGDVSLLLRMLNGPLFMISMAVVLAPVVHTERFRMAYCIYLSGLIGVLPSSMSIIYGARQKFEKSSKLGFIGDIIIEIGWIYMNYIIFETHKLDVFSIGLYSLGFYLFLIVCTGLCGANIVLYLGRKKRKSNFNNL